MQLLLLQYSAATRLLAGGVWGGDGGAIDMGIIV